MNTKIKIVLLIIIGVLFISFSKESISKRQSEIGNEIFKAEIKGEIEEIYFNRTGEYLKLKEIDKRIKFYSQLDYNEKKFSEIAVIGNLVYKKENSCDMRMITPHKMFSFQIC